MPICIIIYIYNVIYIYIPFICKNVPHCNLPLILLTKKRLLGMQNTFSLNIFYVLCTLNLLLMEQRRYKNKQVEFYVSELICHET